MTPPGCKSGAGGVTVAGVNMDRAGAGVECRVEPEVEPEVEPGPEVGPGPEVEPEGAGVDSRR